MQKRFHNFERIVNKIIIGCFLSIVLYLFLISCFGSVYEDGVEREYFVRDLFWVKLLSVGIMLLLIPVIGKMNLKLPRVNPYIKGVFTVIYVGIMVAYVITLQLYPDADQGQCVNAAAGILQGDYSMWQKGGYMEFHPHQWGFVWYLYLCFLPFGVGKAFAPQFMNILALVMAAHYLAKISGLLFKEQQYEDYVYYLSLLFLPLNGFVVYVYGIIPGLALGVCGIYYILLYMKEKKVKYGFLGMMWITFAYCLKSNYLLFFVAVMMVLVIDAIARKEKETIAVIASGIVFLTLISSGISLLTTSVTKYPKEGIPMKSYLLMGLQESPLGPGMYNGIHINIYTSTGYDKAMSQEVTNILLKDQIDTMLENPMSTLNFFARKIAGQWNEASFESTWISGWRMSFGPRSEWIKYFLYDGYEGNILLKRVLSIVLTLYWLGLVLFAIYEPSRSIDKILPIIIFMGGFAYHLLFEVKPQYVLPYIFVMIPFALRGYVVMTNYIREEKGAQSRKKGIILPVILIIMVFVELCPLNITDQVLKIRYRDTEYRDYMAGLQNAIEVNETNLFFTELTERVNQGK